MNKKNTKFQGFAGEQLKKNTAETEKDIAKLKEEKKQRGEEVIKVL